MSVGESHFTAGMTAGYKLSDVNDFSGNSRTLTNNGAVTFTTGIYGNCADFGTSGTGKSLSRTDNAGITLANNYVVRGWFAIVTLPTAGEYQIIYDNRLNTGRYHYFSITHDSGVLKVRLYNTGTNVLTAYTPVVNTWYRYILVNNSDVLYVYIDGVLITSAVKGSTNASQTSINLGGASASYTIKGKLDDVVLQQETITNQDIIRDYAWCMGKLV